MSTISSPSPRTRSPAPFATWPLSEASSRRARGPYQWRPSSPAVYAIALKLWLSYPAVISRRPNSAVFSLAAAVTLDPWQAGSRARDTRGVRVGIAHHLGWAVAVTASAGHDVVDRRRIELIEPGLSAAPVEHEVSYLGDEAAARMVAAARASALRAASASLDQLAASLPGPVVSLSLRAWPLDFPGDIAIQRRPPYQSPADPVMYCQVLADCAHQRRW